MSGRFNTGWLISVMLPVAACVLVLTGFAPAQNRGVYPLGMDATSSGVTPEPVNQLLIYSQRLAALDKPYAHRAADLIRKDCLYERKAITTNL
jgi:hypothetical protein